MNCAIKTRPTVLAAINVPSMTKKNHLFVQVGASWEKIVANEIMNPNLVKQLLYHSVSLNVNSVQGTQRKWKIMQGGHGIQEMSKKGHTFTKLDWVDWLMWLVNHPYERRLLTCGFFFQA